jgi:hypothetical protein
MTSCIHKTQKWTIPIRHTTLARINQPLQEVFLFLQATFQENTCSTKYRMSAYTIFTTLARINQPYDEYTLVCPIAVFMWTYLKIHHFVCVFLNVQPNWYNGWVWSEHVHIIPIFTVLLLKKNMGKWWFYHLMLNMFLTLASKRAFRVLLLELVWGH